MVGFYKTPLEDIIVLVDDMDTDVGKIRLRLKGKAGGHNGLKSIIHELHSEEFKRIRIGISKPEGNIVNYVLGRPSKEESILFEEGKKKAAEALLYSLDNSFEKAMSKYNI